MEDINLSVRRTNAVLRGVNAIRHSVNDLKDLAKRPTAAKFLWTLIQISRAYTAWRRVYKLAFKEVSSAAAFMRMPRPNPPRVRDVQAITQIPDLDLTAFDVRVDAFRENIPMRRDLLDLSGLPEKSTMMIQAIMEEDADITVSDAKELLSSRIIHPEESTGFLESTIFWQPEVFGTRIVAGAPYAWWVERGHDNFTGHWYMRDATDRARIRLEDKIWKQIKGLLDVVTI